MPDASSAVERNHKDSLGEVQMGTCRYCVAQSFHAQYPSSHFLKVLRNQLSVLPPNATSLLFLIQEQVIIPQVFIRCSVNIKV